MTSTTSPTEARPKIVLNLGCGTHQTEIPPGWTEIRVDADPSCDPDVVADLTDLPFPDGYADGIFCDSVLEHLEEYRVGLALREFARVLRDGGILCIRVPDLQKIAEFILEGRLLDELYPSPAGPVRPIDLLYGHGPQVAFHPLMAHRTGFTAASLSLYLQGAGFDGTVARMEGHELWAEVRKC